TNVDGKCHFTCKTAISSLRPTVISYAQISIEGNIGSGKTTFLEYFQRECGSKVQTFREPVHKWLNLSGHNLLDLMYKEPKRWSFAFQQYVQLTMFQMHKEASEFSDDKCCVKMIERSLLSARYCFVENLYENELLHDVEYKIIDEWFKELMKDKCTKLDYIIYLRTSPEVCYQRVKQRFRREEETLTMEYLKNLHQLHEKWLLSDEMNIPVITINGDHSIAEMQESYDKCSQIMFKAN
ncbi:hypothetical protein B4U79_15446, partial [Dinothrombium tinctorium]